MKKELNLLKKENKEIRRKNENMKKAIHKGNVHEQPANAINEDAMTTEETLNPFEIEEENSNWAAEVSENFSKANNDGDRANVLMPETKDGRNSQGAKGEFHQANSQCCEVRSGIWCQRIPHSIEGFG